MLPTIQLTLRPGIIDLGWGHPDPALLPVAAVRAAAAAALDMFGADALAYGADPGAGPLRAWLAEYIGQTEGRAPAPDEIALTGGSSLGLDQVLTLLTQPGDALLVESPTYHLAVRVMKDHPLDLVPVPADADGLRVDLLPDLLIGLRRAGRRPRMLYTVPTFNNPTGVSLSAERRAALVALAAAEQLTVIEDDVYRELAYDGPAPASLWSLAPDHVLRLGSFAKSLAPGLRLGYITGPAALVQRIVGGGVLDSGGGVNHFSAMTVAALCRSGGFTAQVTQLRAAYRARRDALAAALTAELPDTCRWSVPVGGFFQWVQLPSGVDARALLERAEAAGVSFLPGTKFHLDGAGANTLRLAFSLYGPEQLAAGARLLGAALRG